MRRLITLVAISLTYVAFSLAQDSYGDRFLLSPQDFPSARCLDGTMSGFYFRAARNQSMSGNFMISMEGGGECVDKSSCYDRTKTQIGSSSAWKPRRTMYGLQTGNLEANPLFGPWNQIFIPYCTGDLFLGMDEGPNERAWGLQFSGYHVVKGVIHHLIQKMDLLKATSIIISGESAGGIGAVALADLIADEIRAAIVSINKVNPSSNHLASPRIVLVPVAGSYFSNEAIYQPIRPDDPAQSNYIPWAYRHLRDYYTLWNAFVPTRCASQRPHAPWECIFLSASYETLTLDLFAIQAQTDAVVMPLHAGLPNVWSQGNKQCNQTLTNCPTTLSEFIISWAKEMKSTLAPIDKGTKSPRDGMFFAACLTHTGFNANYPIIDRMNVYKALGQWYFQRSPRSIFMDRCPNDGVFCGTCTPMS